MHPYETNGQHLARYLLDHHLDGRGRRWSGLGPALLASDRGDDWVEAFQEMVSLQLARRLIAAGEKLIGRHGLAAAEVEIKQVIIDTMVVHFTSAGDVYERLFPAIQSARQTISNSVRQEIAALARREMPFCYLCGTDVDFSADGHQAFTLDHVWPRAYGGNSDFENLLGACRSCNEAKASEPSWAMYPIQSYVAGFEVQDLEAMPKVMRFAVQARAAKQLAQREGRSLRDAYLRLGRPCNPVVLSEATAVDLFNLEFSAR
jgi:hypothetical protein